MIEDIIYDEQGKTEEVKMQKCQTEGCARTTKKVLCSKCEEKQARKYHMCPCGQRETAGRLCASCLKAEDAARKRDEKAAIKAEKNRQKAADMAEKAAAVEEKRKQKIAAWEEAQIKKQQAEAEKEKIKQANHYNKMRNYQAKLEAKAQAVAANANGIKLGLLE